MISKFGFYYYSDIHCPNSQKFLDSVHDDIQTILLSKITSENLARALYDN